jgi:predicted ArsR family transcriptional regulator
MTIEINSGTIEERIIKILCRKYPITVEEMKKEIGISKSILERELAKLQSKQILLLEPLPDKTFIRLLRNDFRFIGKRAQRKFIKIKKGKKKESEKEYDGIMFG